MRPLALSLALLAGCFTPQGTSLEFETLPFENDYTSAPDIVLRPFEYPDLLCPDGEPSVFYAVYRTQLNDPAPIVLFFHAGAFDYITNPDPGNPLDGAGYQDEHRFSAEWAGNKVFETFGLLPGESIDPTEVNLGTLPAALANAGAFTLYPANCWGDLWHNEDYYSPNNWDLDSFHRQGRFLAWWMTRIASQDTDEAAAWRDRYGLTPEDGFPISLDATGVYIVGLGEGGRAAAELLRRQRDAADGDMPAINGMIMDSTMDKLTWIASQDQFARYREGLVRIFPDEVDGDIGMYSMDRWIGEQGLDQTLQIVWSSADTQVPDETLSDLIARESAYSDTMQVTDTATSGHIFLNSDADEARRAVDMLLSE